MFKQTLRGALLSTAIVCAAGAAHADPRTHDGFQFRGAVGAGYLSDSESGGGLKGTISGFAPPFELYLGGTLAPGLAVGGTFNFTIAAGPSYSIDGVGSGTASSDVSLNFLTIGPYVDYYIDPTKGLHVLGTVGYAVENVSSKNSSSNGSTGFGLGLGVGYDWWVGDEWSIGLLGRFTYAHMTQSAGGITVTDNTITPAILASFTYQ